MAGDGQPAPFGSVLVALAGDLDHAATGLQPAMSVAAAVGVRLIVHRTVHPSAGIRLRRMWNRPHNRQAATDQLVAATTERLGRVIEAIEPTPSCEVSVEVGRWPDALVSEIHRARHDLVVVSVDGGGNTVSQIRRLLRVCPCSLLVISGLAPGPVIAAIDLADGDSFNRSILRRASLFAEANHEALHVIHALGNGVRGSHIDHTGQTSTDVRPDDVDRRSQAMREVTTLVPGSPRSDRTRILVEFGDPVDIVTHTAAKIGAALVVVGSTGRIGAKQRLTGTTAERLLASRRQSVLIVHPSAMVDSGALRRSGSGRSRRVSPPPRN